MIKKTKTIGNMKIERILEEQQDLREQFRNNFSNLSTAKQRECSTIELMEHHYLKKYYYFLKFAQDEMLKGFNTKEKIRNDWYGYWGTGAGLSEFAVGAERIVYALLNGKGIGVPNSCPVGSDLMFELDDAFIHIDLKSVGSNNIGDYQSSIFIGENQNSYSYVFHTRQGRVENYSPNLPCYYTVKENGKDVKKVCLSYFVTILYDDNSLETLCIALLCMPNGRLSDIYKNAPLRAGKNPGKTRFDFTKLRYFETMSETKSYPRIKIIYLNDKCSTDPDMKEKLEYIRVLYNSSDNEF